MLIFVKTLGRNDVHASALYFANVMTKWR